MMKKEMMDNQNDKLEKLIREMQETSDNVIDGVEDKSLEEIIREVALEEDMTEEEVAEIWNKFATTIMEASAGKSKAKVAKAKKKKKRKISKQSKKRNRK